MDNPLYQVGEEVILKSKNLPHLNGECVVLEVQPKILRFNPITKRRVDSYLYVLTIDTTTNAPGWCESAIRKKHKPADESLSEIIANINKVTV